MQSPDLGKTDGLGGGFGPCRKQRSKADVIGSLTFGGSSLRQRMCRFPHQTIACGQIASLGDTKIVLSHMASVGFHLSEEVRVIVEDKGYVSRFGKWQHSFRIFGNFRLRMLLRAELQ